MGQLLELKVIEHTNTEKESYFPKEITEINMTQIK
jgi:hypothetical protein